MPFFTDGWTTTLNIYSQVGLVTLVGLVSKNGILIVEFANKLQEAGHTKLEAVREAAHDPPAAGPDDQRRHHRRPLPADLVTGPGAAARNSIGLVLVAGMAIGTALHAVLRAGHLPAHRPRPPGRVGGRGARERSWWRAAQPRAGRARALRRRRRRLGRRRPPDASQSGTPRPREVFDTPREVFDTSGEGIPGAQVRSEGRALRAHRRRHGVFLTRCLTPPR